MKPSKARLKEVYKAPLHRKQAKVSAMLSKELRARYKKRSIRVRVGDVVKVMRGEYKGIEGKVIKVHTDNARLEIEGIQREKLRGGNAPVLIHASKVMITSLDLSDEWRKKRLEEGKG